MILPKLLIAWRRHTCVKLSRIYWIEPFLIIFLFLRNNPIQFPISVAVYHFVRWKLLFGSFREKLKKIKKIDFKKSEVTFRSFGTSRAPRDARYSQTSELTKLKCESKRKLNNKRKSTAEEVRKCILCWIRQKRFNCMKHNSAVSGKSEVVSERSGETSERRAETQAARVQHYNEI